MTENGPHPNSQGDQRVAVWRRILLPGSETFIRGQMDHLTSWEPALFGLEDVESVLTAPDDFVLYRGQSTLARIQRKVFKAVRRNPRLKRAMQAHGTDLIHAHFLPDAWIVLKTAQQLKVPLVVTAHGYDASAWLQVDGLRGWIRRQRVRRLADYASEVIAVSDFIASELIRAGVPQGKIVTRYIGISTGQVGATGEERTTDLVFVGRLVAKKGVDDLLRAISLSRRAVTPSLEIVGSGMSRDSLEALSEDLGVGAHFVGSAPPAEVARRLRSARIFVAPSKTAADGDSEGFGMVFLEAALAGLPVLSYRHGGVPEAVADGVTGTLVPEGDVEQLAAAIDSLLDDPDRARDMGLRGAQRVVSQFDIRELTKGLESAYDTASARPSRS